MSALYCPKCGKQVTPEAITCPNCGYYLPQPPPPAPAAAPTQKINTHTLGWTLMAFLVSLLWFKINNAPVFPLGFIGGLVIILFSSHIDKQVGKQSLAPVGFALSFVGMILGAIIR
jgi:hypothetical protein